MKHTHENSSRRRRQSRRLEGKLFFCENIELQVREELSIQFQFNRNVAVCIMFDFLFMCHQHPFWMGEKASRIVEHKNEWIICSKLCCWIEAKNFSIHIEWKFVIKWTFFPPYPRLPSHASPKELFLYHHHHHHVPIVLSNQPECIR